MKQILEDLNDQEILAIALQARSFHDFLKRLGCNTNGGTDYKFYRDYFNNRELNLKFAGTGCNVLELDGENKIKRRYENFEIFVEGSSIGRASLKKRILSEKLLTYVCNDCGNGGIWNGKKMVLQLEHKNGINNDNRLDNLCFLCPNCHSQTNTFGSKNYAYKTICKCGNKKDKNAKMCLSCEGGRRIEEGKKNRPDIKIVIDEIKKMGYCAVGRKYGVSDNAIRKWIKMEGLDPKKIK